MGLIHLYCGDGNGKTTAALGLALRAQGAGFYVIIAQFLKSQPSGELKALALLPPVTVLRSAREFGFTWTLSDEERMILREDQEQLFRCAVSACPKEKRVLLVLDEVVSAQTYGYLAQGRLEAYVSKLPENIEAVLTGRDPSAALVTMSDYVTEMKKIKHPFDRGVPARDGIEF